MKPTNKLIGILLLIAILLTVSCAEDEIDRTPIPPQDPRVTFSLQAPRAGTKATPAAAAAVGTGLTDEEERAINNLTILVFTENATPDLLCEYMLENQQPIPVPGTENGQYTVTATLPKGYYRLMFLANVADKITADPPIGKMLSTIESTLLHEMQTKWDIYAHPGFPMSGATTGLIMVTGSHTYPEPIVMLRMLARINLSVASDVKDNIKINAIHLHNPSSRGLVMPSEANLDTTAATGYIRAMAPTLPLNTAGTPDPGLLATPWEYTSAEILNGDSCYNTIYAMEGFAPQGLSQNEYAWLELTCSYKGQPEETYRIDFLHTLDDGTREPIGLLRNHSYEITILSMTGEAELEFEVMEWNDSDMSDIIIEGRYFLKVNQSNIELDREPKDANSFTNKLTIQTNYEDGWIIDRLTTPNDGAPINMDNGWIQIAQGDRTGSQNQEKTISVLLEENTTNSSRSAEIHLRVGRLIDFIVTVIQRPDREIELHIEDLDGNPIEELIFYDFYGNTTPYEEKAFRVRWAPYGTDNQGVPFTCEVRTTLVGNDYFDYKAGTERIITGTLTDPTGMKEYIIEPQPFTEEEVSELLGNPFLQHASWVTFTVTDPADESKTVSKTIFLNHQHIAILSRNFQRLSYLSRTYQFQVLANTPFIVESVDNPEGAFVNHTQQGFTGGNNIVRGTTLTYTTQTANVNTAYMNGIGQAGHKATFYLRDQRGLIPDPIPFTVSAIYDDPNCYLVAPPASGNYTLNIPVRKLFWMREREAGDTTMDELIQSGNWEPGILLENYYDETGSIDSPVTGYLVGFAKRRAPGGTSALEDVIEVTIPAGRVSANIILGARRPGASTWLWTWHIWLTSFNPDGNTSDRFETSAVYFMKRNIGALSDAELLNPNTTGFYYQWGRKDPLHPDEIPQNRQAIQPGTQNNLLNAINNPATLYTSTSGLMDWYTSLNWDAYQNNLLWDDYEDHKTPYDPCPAGWRVPYFLQNSQNQSIAYSVWGETIFNEIIRDPGTNQVLGYYRRLKNVPTSTDYMFTPATGKYHNDGNLLWYGSTNTSDEFVNGSSLFYNANIDPENPTWGLHAGNSTQGAYDENGIRRASALPVRCIKRK